MNPMAKDLGIVQCLGILMTQPNNSPENDPLEIM